MRVRRLARFGLCVGAFAAGAATPLPLKVIFEGDSISAYTGSPRSMTNQWIDANPTVAKKNLAQVSAKIGQSTDSVGANTLWGRLPDLYAEADGYSVVFNFMVTNDLTEVDATTYIARLEAYIAEVRANIPGVKIGVGTLVPATASYVDYLARRPTVNAWLRAAVGGGVVDFIIPYGEHPIAGSDAAGSDTNIYSDGRHPSSGGHGYLLQTLQAVLDPIVAGATGNNPSAFTLADRVSADPSTAYTTPTTITGMGMGQSATASMTGAGDFARGTEPAGPNYGTGARTVMNGDIILSRVTSHATNGQTVQHVLSAGTRTDTWDVTTAASVATTVWDQANSDTSLFYLSDRKVQGPASGQPGFNSTNNAFATNPKSSGKWAFMLTFGPETGGSSYQACVAGSGTSTSARPGGGAGNSNAGVTYNGSGAIYLNSATAVTGFPTFSAASTILVCVSINPSDPNDAEIWFLRFDSGTNAWVSIQGDPTVPGSGFNPGQTLQTGWRPASSFTRNESCTINAGQEPFPAPLPAGYVQWG